MATSKITKREIQQDEFIEGVFDFGEWLEAHWKRVAVALGAAVALVLAFVAWNGMRERSSEQANGFLASGIDAFAPSPLPDGQKPAPRYAEALTLFEQAAAAGGSQPVGDVARLMKARALISLSRSAEAIPVLEGLGGVADKSLGAEAKVLLAEASEANGNPERAAQLLQELAAPGKSAAVPQDAALMLLGGIRERQGKADDAKRAYAELIARYPQSPFAADAKQRNGG